jgi:hypothetical protein
MCLLRQNLFTNEGLGMKVIKVEELAVYIFVRCSL